MNKHFKIMLVAICVVMMSALVAVAIVANATIETDATLGSIQVATAGSINLRFNYTDLGSAEKMVVEVNKPDGTLYDTWDVPVTEIEDNVVKVPLTPAQMAYTVTVYAVDENGTGAKKTTSVLEYAKVVLATEGYEGYHNSMKALLNWGAMSEMFFDKITTPTANEGLYGRNTNPVQDAVAFFNAEGAVTPSEHITGVSYEVCLDPGNTVMRFKVAYTGANAANLKAYVTKGDVTVETGLQSLGNGEYCVNIHNVGVAVYNTPYTVTVTDGTETFEATKTVLEYLNTLAFTGEDAAQRNIARSMYQFYTHAMGTVNAETCGHTKLHMATTTDGKSEYIACSDCLAKVGDRVVDKNVIWFSNPQEFANYTYQISNGEGGFNKTSYTADVLTENGMPYVRFTVAAGNDRLEFYPLSTQGEGIKTPKLADTGRYVVIKYRATGDAEFHWTVNGSFADRLVVKDVSSAGWMTAVLDFDGAFDLSTGALYYPTENAQIKIVNTINNIKADTTLDVAYVAICDTMESARALLTDGETYRTCSMKDPANGITLRDIMTCTELNNAGECASGVHTVKLGSKATETATVYTYACARCGKELAPSRTVPSTVPFYHSIPAKNLFYDNNKPGGAGYVQNSKPIVEDRVAYISYAPTNDGKGGGTMQAHGTFTGDNTINGDDKAISTVLGKYFVIKYRMPAVTKNSSARLTLQLYIDGKCTEKTLANAVTDKWVTAVVDISGYAGYDEAKVNAKAIQTIKVDFLYESALAISYIAVADDIDDVRAMLLDDETYIYRGKSFANVGTECAKTGCTGEHTYSTNSNNAGDKTAYTYSCSKCGETLAPTRYVPKTVAYYWNPAKVTMWDLNNKPNPGNVDHKPIAKDGEAYVNLKPQAGGKQTASTVVPTVTTTLGKYLAIKYRFTEMEASDTKLYINTIIAGKNNDHQIKSSVTNGWVVAVVDISGFAGYAGSGESASFNLVITHSMELDVAYVVMSDNMADIRALLADGETYVDRGNHFANAGIEKDKTGACVTHALVITSTQVIDNVTRYTYSCSACGAENVAPARDVPKTVKYYWNPTNVRVYDTNGGAHNPVHYPIANDGEVYVNCKPDAGGEVVVAEPTLGTTTPLGKYLAVKYRLRSIDGVKNNSLSIGSGASKNFGPEWPQAKNNAITDGWVVEVVALSGYANYDANKASASFNLQFTYYADLDLAYIVMSDDIKDIQALLGENETYFYHGGAWFDSTGTEYNKDGTPVVAE